MPFCIKMYGVARRNVGEFTTRIPDLIVAQGRKTREHVQQLVWIENARHLLSQCGPVLNLFGRAAMVPGSSQGCSLHQLLLQPHG